MTKRLTFDDMQAKVSAAHPQLRLELDGVMYQIRLVESGGYGPGFKSLAALNRWLEVAPSYAEREWARAVRKELAELDPVLVLESAAGGYLIQLIPDSDPLRFASLTEVSEWIAADRKVGA